LQACL